jgi:hypothetical protein
MELTLCCPEGGDYVVEARLARVTVDEHAQPFVEFPCPGCGKYVACPLEARSALRLISLGLRGTAMRAPAEVIELHDGPPLAPDELLDFHLFLGRSDWLEQLEQELAERPPRPSR